MLYSNITYDWCKTIAYEVLRDCIININLGCMDLEAYLNDPEALERASEGFSRRSNGVLKGAIGATDGWLVNITRPCRRLDKVGNVVGFFFSQRFLCSQRTMHG